MALPMNGDTTVPTNKASKCTIDPTRHQEQAHNKPQQKIVAMEIALE